MSNEHPCKLTMLPAMDGDCFILEFGTGENLFRMMIDGGTVKFGNDKLKEHIRPLVEAGQKIDLLLITHFDRDHIGGALSLLRDDDLCGCVREIWHNGLRQIAPGLPEETDENSRDFFVNKNSTMLETESTTLETGSTHTNLISAKQSQTLSQLIRIRKIKVNSFNSGAAITADTPSMRLGNQGDVEIFFLLPQKEKLDALLKQFKYKIDVPPVLTEECEECFEKTTINSEPVIVTVEGCAAEYKASPNLKKWANEVVPDTDTSKPNASSIAIIIRYHGKTLLFPGDATADDLIPVLEQWRDQQGEDLHFDVVKLPHHGSNRNCRKLLDLDGFDGKLFLISTDGLKHGHPGKESVAKLVVRDTKQTRVLAFNYPHAWYRIFNSPDLQKQYQYLVMNDTDFLGFEVNGK